MWVPWEHIIEVAVSIAGAQLSFYKIMKHKVLNKNLCESKGFQSRDYNQFVVTATVCCDAFVQNWVLCLMSPKVVVCQIIGPHWITSAQTCYPHDPSIPLGLCWYINFIDPPIPIPVTFICGWKLYDNEFWVFTSCWLPKPVKSVFF